MAINLIEKNNKVLPYLLSIGLVLITTLFGIFIKGKLEPTNLVMFYLLAVVIAAINWGKGPAITASIIGVLSFDFFLVPPYYTFTVASVHYIFTFIGLLIVGLVVSTLASRVREQTIKAQKVELLQETEKLQTALLHSISHDLRTPLATITGSLSTILHDDLDLNKKTSQELLKGAKQEADRLNRLVSNLLDMTKMEAGVLRISKKPCDLRDVLGTSLEALKEKVGCREVRISIPADCPEIYLDFSFMIKAFYNLIDNAINYSLPGSPILIRAAVINDRVRIEIIDQGPGIPPADLERIFEKFYRAKSPGRVSGTGLGLSICKGIIEAHNGAIAARNNPAGGATLAISLPLGTSGGQDEDGKK